MDLRDLAGNVKRIRYAQRKMSQKELALRAGLSLSAVKSLEGMHKEPRMQSVQAIADALDVPLHVLFRPVRELQTVRFRAARKMRSREDVLARVTQRLEDYSFLEDILSEKRPFRLAECRDRCAGHSPEEAADLTRLAMGLSSDEPVLDICRLIEEAGIKVLKVMLNAEGFFGLSVGEEDGGPAVVICVNDSVSVERRIFSAVHELGHLILHPHSYDVRKQEENRQEEKEADRFAGFFLLPDKGFRREWNAAAGLPMVDRVLKVKRLFRVSYKTLLKRLIDINEEDETVWARFQNAYRHRFGRTLSYKEEPFGLVSLDFFEDRFNRLIRDAWKRSEITVSRAAELLGCSLNDMQQLISDWEQNS